MGSTLGDRAAWFVKTKEMAAFDRYFSLADVNARGLRDRYRTTLDRFEERSEHYFREPAALAHQWSGPSMRAQVSASIDQHFAGDWVHESFTENPSEYGGMGGKFWPNVASAKVIEGLRDGVTTAIYKALGDKELQRRGMSEGERAALWAEEREQGIEIDDGPLPITMNWLAAEGRADDFFEVGVLRGPTVVSLLIVTPRPAGSEESA
jgi:hypothetical protein